MIDLRTDPSALRVRKKPDPVTVSFADTDGTCATLEGDVTYRAGDALLQGRFGDSWPVSLQKFLSTYTPLPGTSPGKGGLYVKKARTVLARRLKEPAEVPVGWQASTIWGAPGDWLIQYAPGEFGIVAAAIFDATYERCDESPPFPDEQINP